VITKTEIGLYWETNAPDSRVQKIWISTDSDRVELKLELHPGSGSIDPARYFTPIEAMAFAKAFERCAIEALKASA